MKLAILDYFKQKNKFTTYLNDFGRNTHMNNQKPFIQRLESIYQLTPTLTNFIDNNSLLYGNCNKRITELEEFYTKSCNDKNTVLETDSIMLNKICLAPDISKISETEKCELSYTLELLDTYWEQITDLECDDTLKYCNFFGYEIIFDFVRFNNPTVFWENLGENFKMVVDSVSWKDILLDSELIPDSPAAKFNDFYYENHAALGIQYPGDYFGSDP